MKLLHSAIRFGSAHTAAPIARAPSLGVTFCASETEIPGALWDACFPPTVEGRWWYRTLERCGLEDQFTFFYALIQDSTRTVGIAPVFLMRLPLDVVVPDALLPVAARLEKVHPSFWRPLALFVGSPCAEEGRIGLLPEIERRPALLATQRALETKAREVGASMIVWKDFPGSLAADLTWLTSQCRLFRTVSFPGTVVPLAGIKADYFATLSSSRRQRLKRRLRRSADQIAVEVETVQRPDGQMLDEIFGLFWQAYEKGKTKFERLNRRFFELVAQCPASHFIILRERQSRKMVAFMLCFVMADRIINKFIGLDCRRPRNLFLNERLWDAAVDWAIARGVSAIQSGQTGYAGKLMTGHSLVPLYNFCHQRNFFMHAIYRLVGQTISWETLDDELATAIKAHPEISKAQTLRPDDRGSTHLQKARSRIALDN
jgi:Peptidogalycan biosysnthesis/recognition